MRTHHEEAHHHERRKHHHKHHSHHHSHDHEEHEHETEEPLYEFSDELKRKTGLKLFNQLLKALKKDGTTSIAEHELSIPKEAWFTITHEETWDETEKLSLSIEWYPEEDTPAPQDEDE